ncbi:MAG: thiamine phosphate synthase, partial [Dehalococcoidales bacterium]
TPGIALDPEEYRQARFEIYTIEKALLSGVLRKEKVKKLVGLYGVVDTQWLKGKSHIEIAEQLIRGGAKIIQLRCKEGNTRDFLAAANDLKKMCAARDILFIVNDSLEVALAVDADGLHVGQEDLPAAIARKLLSIDMLLGVSVSNVAEAKKALADGADYLGVGAIFATATKESARAVGIEMIKEVKQAVDLPVVAIGGINENNLKGVIEAGADAAAVISAILQAKDIERATMQLTNIFREYKRG